MLERAVLLGCSGSVLRLILVPPAVTERRNSGQYFPLLPLHLANNFVYPLCKNHIANYFVKSKDRELSHSGLGLLPVEAEEDYT